MTKLVFVEPGGARREVEATDGHTVMEAAIAHGINGIVAECAGSLACATCHVFVDETSFQKLAERNTIEQDMLEFAACPVRATSRLSCQITVSEDLAGAVFELPDAQY
ncbi:2Fe-2S iron-sulfur cluster-binding protein [Microbulbifer sp. S227A]|uniref:2Fe-2S iron-sulfur cluster-binding protein n=1 Tax=Microbulbifer sp. S227A TaxID=3415131 RepID=UPI003C7E359C